jgi:signal transduction histidine kinase
LTREREFTQDASHELLTPLASLRGTLSVLIRQPRSQQHYSEKIAACIEEVDRLTNMADQLLVIARADRGALKPVLAPVNLSGRIEDTVERLEPLALSKEISIRFSPPRESTVHADASMLNRMLENLISNAIKYSDRHQTIDIDVRRQNASVLLSITDHGIGLTEEQKQRVFDRFYRADPSRSSKVPGAGLGLAIVKRLADLQGIILSVQSTPAVGSTFVLTFSSLPPL